MREDFQDHEREAELGECRADVGAFEGALGGAYLDESGGVRLDSGWEEEGKLLFIC